MLNLAGEIFDSLSNGPGMRYVLFTQGCTHECEGCHNQHTWQLKDNLLISVEEIYNNILSMPYIDGITLSGGEPFLQAKELSKLTKMIKANTNLNICCYTGFTYESLIDFIKLGKILPEEFKYFKNLLDDIDILIDGKFEKDLTDKALEYTGSANQRILKLKKGVVYDEQVSSNYYEYKKVSGIES